MNILFNNQRLNINDRLTCANGNFFVVMQEDSNLVIYDNARKPFWASNTVGSDAQYAVMQADGNFVLYTKADKPVWASNTTNHANAFLIMQNDRNLVIYQDPNEAIWASDTWIRPADSGADSKKWGATITTKGLTALGGNIEVIANKNGDWTINGHLHDSGFDPYSFTLVAVIVTPSGIGYTLSKHGHTDGTSSNLFGHVNRDCNWTDSGNNPSIKDNWAEVENAQISWHLESQDMNASAIQDTISDILKDAAKEGVKALIKLIAA